MMASPSPCDDVIGTTSGSEKLPIRVLSLDGGGIRGLSSLILLRKIMEGVAATKGISVHDAYSIRPSEYFDLIVGTGMGGISALFLGRLRMTVDEAIAEYQQVAKAAFQLPSFFSRNIRLSTPSGNLERCISNIIRRYLDDKNAPLCDPAGETFKCRTAVLACTSAIISAAPHVFRSYATSEPPSPFTIVEVARATIATAGIPPVSLGNPPVQFMSAGVVGYNNPAEVVLQEAAMIWPECHGRVDSLVSIGTGLQKLIQLGGRWKQRIRACELIAQSCEPVHRRMYLSGHHTNMAYFRFNVPQGLSDVDIREWTQPDSSFITGISEGYARDPQVAHLLRSCVRTLLGDFSEVAGNATHNKTSPGQKNGKFLPLQNPAPEIFHGREDYTKQAVSMLVNRSATRLALLGPGGIGKTSIALTVLHTPAIKDKFGQQARFVSCEAITSSASLVDTLCAAFDLHNLSGDRQNDLLVYLMQTYTSLPLLLILDNFETVWDVGKAKSESEALLQRLGSVPLLSLIVTLRGTTHPAGVQWTKPLLPIVDKLLPTEAYRVFMDIYGKDDDDKLDQLLYAVDYVPLAVTLMARLGSVFTPGHLLEKWTKEKTGLLSHPYDQGRLENIDVSIRISLKSLRMQSTPVALELLSILVLLPGGMHIDDLTAIAPRLEGCEPAVFTLLSVGLAQMDSMNVLHVLSPIRAYIMQYHKPRPELLKDVQTHFFTLATLGKKQPGDDGYEAAVSKLRKVESNMEAILISAIEHKDEPKHCLQAALNWTRYLAWQTPRSDIIRLAVRLAKSEKLENFMAECLHALGETERILNHYDEAERMLSNAQTKYEVLGNQLGAARCLYNLGEIQRMLNCYDKAQQLLSMAQTKFEVVENQLGATQCMQHLGNIECMLYHYDKAQEVLSNAQMRFEVLGDQLGATQCLKSLGDLQYMLNHFDEAQEMLSNAQTRFEALGSQLGATQCLQSLGFVQFNLEHYDEAQNKLTDAHTRFEVLGDQLGAAQCLQHLGNIQFKLHHYDEAQRKLFDAHIIFEEIGNQIGAAQCLRSMGNIQYMLCHYDEAQQILADAQTKFEVIREQLGAAYCLRLRGHISHAQNRVEQAVIYFTQAKEKFACIGPHTQAHQDKCSQELIALSSLLSEEKCDPSNSV